MYDSNIRKFLSEIGLTAEEIQRIEDRSAWDQKSFRETVVEILRDGMWKVPS